ncbi:MAG: histidine phosphatase family protein [bacterium]|nr:histidine phosphatase family protein [bacterium]
MSIYLIRHGQTAGNAERRLQLPGVPLDDAGHEQARCLAARLRDAGIGHVLSSDLTRAHQTAEAVAHETGAPVELEPLLQERSYGDLRGTLHSELPADLFTEAFDPPGGESPGVFRERVAAAWQRVVGFSAEVEARGHLAVVTHGLVYRAIIARHTVMEARPVLHALGNTALSIIDRSPPHEISLLACTTHLDEQASSVGVSRSGVA